MRFLIRWTIGGWLVFASPAFADEAIESAEVKPNDAVLDDVVGTSVNTTAAVAQRAATPARSDGTSPARSAPPICMPDSPRCLLFATTGNDAAWDGQSVLRDVSGPPGTWRQKGRR